MKISVRLLYEYILLNIMLMKISVQLLYAYMLLLFILIR